MQPAFGRIEARHTLQFAFHERQYRRDLAIGVIQGAGALQLTLAVVEFCLRALGFFDLQRAVELAIDQLPAQLAVTTLQVEFFRGHRWAPVS
ncbi:hypothetical protein D3C71_1928230 [compost metagenome]